ncbi:Tetratricopeptide repeat-containing protein [Sinosporangium album]|uniref:Tetratricopeptide repeat-containing protein n=1 Tax=Sinosporangium album TaxID=504805 RepID=A0A1G7WFQ3_9ACTN|nr:tetratricopeptide repeat protein [Sinosporangium album]SDG70803.1 Tetratricopeptide repeat-containing protein [Sinosporangium album]
MIQGRDGSSDFSANESGKPDGDVYDWFQRGSRLLKEGSPAAAAALLERAAEAEPESRSIREALARAQFNSRQYAQAVDSFRQIVAANPAEDYAYYGLGLALWRTGDMEAAQEPLAIAVAMRPDQRHYVTALNSVRATLRARRAAS